MSSCTPNRNLYGANTNFAGTSSKQKRQSNEIDLERDPNEDSNLTTTLVQKELFNKVHLQMQNRIEYQDYELNENDIMSPAEQFQEGEELSYRDPEFGGQNLEDDQQQLRVAG